LTLSHSEIPDEEDWQQADDEILHGTDNGACNDYCALVEVV
jgi:hypothetical protein